MPRLLGDQLCGGGSVMCARQTDACRSAMPRQGEYWAGSVRHMRYMVRMSCGHFRRRVHERVPGEVNRLHASCNLNQARNITDLEPQFFPSLKHSNT